MTLIAHLKHWIKQTMPSVARRFGSYRTLPDRRLLEDVIIPYFANQPGPLRVLFVGCDWYTAHYRRLFRGHDYWTIDNDPAKRRFGGNRHLVAPLDELDHHVAPEQFDLILCNGVFMVGAIDTRPQAEASFRQCFRGLRPGGILVVGWNDTPELRPYPLEDNHSLEAFEPFVFPPLTCARYLTATTHRHTFSFFRKPQPVHGVRSKYS